MRCLDGATPPVGTRGHPSRGDTAEEPRQVLRALRGLLPALVADTEHFGSRMANKACVGLPGWGNPPGEPKQSLVGAWGCGVRGSLDEGHTQAPSSCLRAKWVLRTPPHPGAAFAGAGI